MGNEYNEHAADTYAHNFPGVRLIRKDIRDVSVDGEALDPVDILHAGFPCQSFSQAGTRSGFEDERGQLFFELIRILKEFGEDRPKVLVLESDSKLSI